MIASALIALPVAAAGLCAIPFVSRFARLIAVLASLLVATLALASVAWPIASDLRVAWAPPLAIRYAVAMDGASATLLALGGVLFAAGAAASARVPDRRAYFALWCLLLAAVDGVLVARDLGLFLLFWEAMLVAASLLVWRWGGAQGRAAATRFLFSTLAGSALLAVTIVSLASARGTLDLDLLRDRPIAPSGQLLPALLALAPFAIALPLFPLHGWMPRLFASAPIPVSVVVAGVIGKTAVYGIVRVGLDLFPQGMAAAAPALVAVAAVGTLYAALAATRQDDVRRVLAFASVSYMNLIALGLFAATTDGVRAAFLAGVSHGLVLGTLLLLALLLARRTHSFSLARAGGLAAPAPVLAGLSTIAVLAWAGAPLTSGFAADVSVLAGAYARFPAAAVTAALALVITAYAGTRVLRRAYHGPPLASGSDLGWRERLLVIPLLVLVVSLGVAPGIVTDRLPDDVLPSTGTFP